METALDDTEGGKGNSVPVPVCCVCIEESCEQWARERRPKMDENQTKRQAYTRKKESEATSKEEKCASTHSFMQL